MKIVISHIRNEEYLLQWWLPHHFKMFDHGVIIDYHSTDNSLELVKKLAPGWTILTSRNSNFSVRDVDAEVSEIEESLFKQFPDAWITVLNTTEFLIGNLNILDEYRGKKQVLVATTIMIDHYSQIGIEPDPNLPLIDQRTYGLEWSTNPEILWVVRGCRSFNSAPIDYLKDRDPGRLYLGEHDLRLSILWYGLSPYTELGIKRKLAIKEQIIDEDKKNNYGYQHLFDRKKLNELLFFYQDKIKDLSNIIGYIKNHDVPNIIIFNR
jgi:hypothetical protein